MAPPTVRVLLFGPLREAMGVSSLDVPLPQDANGDALLDALEQQHAAIRAHRPTLRLAVNEAWALTDATLCDGDTVALLTPSSGG